MFFPQKRRCLNALLLPTNVNFELIRMCVVLFREISGLGIMYVIKRNGRKEEVQFDKITARIKKLVSQKVTTLFSLLQKAHLFFCNVIQVYGLDQNYVQAVMIAQKVTQGVYTGVTTSELDELAAQTGNCLRRPPHPVLSETYPFYL